MKRLWYRLIWLWSWRQRRKYPRHNSKRCDTCTAGDFCIEVYCNVPLVIDEVGPPVPSDCLRLYDGSVVKFEGSGSVPMRAGFPVLYLDDEDFSPKPLCREPQRSIAKRWEEE